MSIDKPNEMKKEYVIDGENFSSLEEFYEEVSRILIPGSNWGRNLDAFNDILRGGFGTPEEGFILKWKNSNTSKRRLGYPATVNWLKQKLERCHPSNKDSVAADIVRAEKGEGQTIYDVLIGIINVHTSAGEESEDGVELVLE